MHQWEFPKSSRPYKRTLSAPAARIPLPSCYLVPHGYLAIPVEVKVSLDRAPLYTKETLAHRSWSFTVIVSRV